MLALHEWEKYMLIERALLRGGQFEEFAAADAQDVEALCFIDAKRRNAVIGIKQLGCLPAIARLP
jgi:hypothetical protein